MKTLDEVINIMEGCGLIDWGADALHYLKEFKRISAKLEKIALGNITETLEKLDNPALDWQELKQMEGKPVWVEGEHGCIWDQKSWVLIRLDNENEDLIICVATNNGHYEFAIGKEDYGKDWQAYRKERS